MKKLLSIAAVATMMIPVQLHAEESFITVKANGSSITVTASGFNGQSVIRGYKANEYPPGISNGISKENMSPGESLGTISSGESLIFPRYAADGYDRIYERFAAVNNGIVVTDYKYADVPKAKNIRFNQKSIKGIFSENMADASYARDLKANSTVINIDTSSLPDISGKSDIVKSVNGKAYHFRKGYVQSLDKIISAYTKEKMNVTAVCVNWGSSNVFDYDNMKKARVSGFNTSTDKGRDWFTATMEFLADRYSKGSALIQDYVIGNEIDSSHETYECDNINTYMEEYYRGLRIANTAVKKYASDACVIVPFTHYWAKSCSEITGDKGPTFRTTDIINWLQRKAVKEGNFDFGIAPHLYASSLFESNYTGVDTASGLVTHNSDSPELTYTNLEQLSDFFQKNDITYNKKTRYVYFTEGGPSAGADNELARNEQAASLAFAYYKASQYPFVREFNEYRLFDNPKEAGVVRAGLMTEAGEKRPSYEVYKHIDQADTFSCSNKYLPYLEIHKNTWGQTISDTFTSWNPLSVLNIDANADRNTFFADNYGIADIIQEVPNTVPDSNQNEILSANPQSSIINQSNKVDAYKSSPVKKEKKKTKKKAKKKTKFKLKSGKTNWSGKKVISVSRKGISVKRKGKAVRKEFAVKKSSRKSKRHIKKNIKKSKNHKKGKK